MSPKSVNAKSLAVVSKVRANDPNAIRQLARISSQGGGQQRIQLSSEDEKKLAEALAEQYGIPNVDPEAFDVDPGVRDVISRNMATKHTVVPLSRSGNTVVLAMADPSNIQAIDEIRFATKLNIEVVVAPATSITKKIDAIYSSAYQFSQAIESAEETGEMDLNADEIVIQTIKGDTTEAPIIRLVNLFILDAVRKGASDIHVEPYEKSLRVRFRVDGVLHEISEPPLKYKDQIVARIKVMADLDIAEKRLPQDGRIKIRTRKGKEVDFRVSVLPMIHGEKIVMRLLDQESLQLDMTKLGFEEDELEKFRKAINEPWGMVLVTGPTGSGKSTTLYSAMMELNKADTNISTAEDPVEYQLPGINQVQMHDDIGLNFASTLRAFLRQDPDIIMVGEVRDYETAEIAIKASLTGHMVLSTLHTNDAPSSISRLVHMGIEPFLITASLTLVQAQRLIRKLCPQCKRASNVDMKVLRELGVPQNELHEYEVYEPVGFPACGHSGYKGRLGIYEVMPVTNTMKEKIINGGTALELKELAMQEGMRTLRGSALIKLKRGLTSIDEVLRSSVRD